MRRHGIGGALDYSRLAQLNDPQAIAREVRRLHHTGLKPVTSPFAVRAAIEPANFLATACE